MDGRSTLPGSENDMSMNQCLEGFEEEPVPQPFVFLAGSGAHTLKGASRDSNLGTDGRAAAGTVQRAETALPNAVPAGSGVLAPSLVGTGRRALRARRRVQVSASDRCVPSSRKEFESCFEACGRVITCDSDLAMLSLPSSYVPCLSASAVSVGPSRGRALSGVVSCVRCGVALVVGSGALCESCAQVVSCYRGALTLQTVQKTAEIPQVRVQFLVGFDMRVVVQQLTPGKGQCTQLWSSTVAVLWRWERRQCRGRQAALVCFQPGVGAHHAGDELV